MRVFIVWTSITDFLSGHQRYPSMISSHMMFRPRWSSWLISEWLIEFVKKIVTSVFSGLSLTKVWGTKMPERWQTSQWLPCSNFRLEESIYYNYNCGNLTWHQSLGPGKSKREPPYTAGNQTTEDSCLYHRPQWLIRSSSSPACRIRMFWQSVSYLDPSTAPHAVQVCQRTLAPHTARCPSHQSDEAASSTWVWPS